MRKGCKVAPHEVAAGNIGAVLDGFVFPQLATHFGWRAATAGPLPLLALAAFLLVERCGPEVR
jgi:nitrate/nitrite transporter NarK